MCGRTACSLNPDAIQHQTGAVRVIDAGCFRPSYNIGPGAYVPVLMFQSESEQAEDSEEQTEAHDEDGAEKKGEDSSDQKLVLTLQFMKWGLVSACWRSSHRALKSRFVSLSNAGMQHTLACHRFPASSRCSFHGVGCLELVSFP